VHPAGLVHDVGLHDPLHGAAVVAGQPHDQVGQIEQRGAEDDRMTPAWLTFSGR